MVLTYTTKNHDFYCQDPNYVYTGPEGQRPYARLYNIVPKGKPAPTGGYFNPRYILDIKGYSTLRVYEVFSNHFKK